ncbi:hypothetical protein phytr_10950 [Candidatus Phycorickettsia trachydisci]|uniref:Uncharacterized protein n=1 Tax=Candidatus Phycorickettsia trachydisci TaxID=2115978 RepID=A0A2P1P9S4_9RICK|nr:hypothetical protein [Candidatus Phycorickettsia trachydisci]AVP88021.1 hypothetical protein phytr_10950 [Candidatus Phycorickettsia trachydisci]
MTLYNYKGITYTTNSIYQGIVCTAESVYKGFIHLVEGAEKIMENLFFSKVEKLEEYENINKIFCDEVSEITGSSFEIDDNL